MGHKIFEGDRKSCYGCGACLNICSKNAIQMTLNFEGFAYPKINEALCMSCNKCNKCCPVTSTNLSAIRHEQSDNVYAVWAKSYPIIIKSASGGVFPILATEILSKGGVVYGVILNKDDFYVKHIRISQIKELDELKGSKYVQSDTGNSFYKVKKDLNNDITVLYSGTGCQIAGLRLYLGKDYDNLYTIDLICHGVPSQKILNSYIKYSESKSKNKLLKLKFRAKTGVPNNTFVLHHFSNGKSKYIPEKLDPYMIGYIRGAFSRESCFACAFASPKRVSDITLGDYWGVSVGHPELDKDKENGISIVICNTKRGINLFDLARQNLNVVQSTFEKAALENTHLTHPPLRPELRNKLYHELDENGFNYLATQYFLPKTSIISKYTPEWIKRRVRFVINLIKKQ